MKNLKFTLDRSTLETIYTSFVRPILDYGSSVWNNCAVLDEDQLENIQLDTARTSLVQCTVRKMQNFTKKLDG